MESEVIRFVDLPHAFGYSLRVLNTAQAKAFLELRDFPSRGADAVQSLIDGLCHAVVESWPLVAAALLILLKQFYKLYVNHKPDKVDYIKAVTSLPLDVSFMVVGIFFKIAITPEVNASPLGGLFMLYFFVGLFTTVLWRVCENAIKSDAMQRVLWAFSLNSTISVVGLVVAIKYAG